MAEATKRKGIQEQCTNTECTTPSCPYRRSRNAEIKKDFSQECGYYSTEGDGRYAKRNV